MYVCIMYVFVLHVSVAYAAFQCSMHLCSQPVILNPACWCTCFETALTPPPPNERGGGKKSLAQFAFVCLPKSVWELQDEVALA